MNIYKKKQNWKLLLLILAMIIGVGSLWYTDYLITKLADEERKKVELWATAQKEIASVDLNNNRDFAFLLKVIQNNETVPVIVVDSLDNYITSRNLDTGRIHNQRYFERNLQHMKEENDPIVIELPGNDRQYIYYDRSTILNYLQYYPFVQLSVILMFVLVSYFAFSWSRRAEQNQVWVGMSKETAHQLGTPTSSLIAWVELLKLKNADETVVMELEKDVKRLEKITDRFSKIGSKPVLKEENIVQTLENSLNYLRARAPKSISLNIIKEHENILVPLNIPRFEWVIENLCKNAMDAIIGNGSITLKIKDNARNIYIDIMDTGKGVSKSKQKAIFKPGYTTKKRGWGLGLSLTKRIIEEYHDGKIFVLHSEINKGTTFRIVLRKNIP